jgi:hypothetical protein
MYNLRHQDENNAFLHGKLQLLVIANVVRCSLILFTLMMEAISSSETPALARATRVSS